MVSFSGCNRSPRQLSELPHLPLPVPRLPLYLMHALAHHFWSSWLSTPRNVTPSSSPSPSSFLALYPHSCSPTGPLLRFSSKPPTPSSPSLPSPLHFPTPPTALVLTTKCRLQGDSPWLPGMNRDSGLLQVVQMHFKGPEGWKKEDSSSAGVGNE